MAIYPVVCVPDPRLRETTETITHFDQELHTLLDDMIETMYYAQGVGLAATQIGISKRIAVIDASREHNQAFCIINPEIIAKEGLEMMEEGCLSVPGVYDKVPRALKVTVRAQDRNGKVFELEADGLLAHILQHEIDHLNGKVNIDYLSPLKQARAVKKVEKLRRHSRKG